MIPRITDFDLANTIITNKRLAMRYLLTVTRTAAAVFKIVRGTGRAALRRMETAVTRKCTRTILAAIRRMTNITRVAMLAAILQTICLTSLVVFMISIGAREIAFRWHSQTSRYNCHAVHRTLLCCLLHSASTPHAPPDDNLQHTTSSRSGHPDTRRFSNLQSTDSSHRNHRNAQPNSAKHIYHIHTASNRGHNHNGHSDISHSFRVNRCSVYNHRSLHRNKCGWYWDRRMFRSN